MRKGEEFPKQCPLGRGVVDMAKHCDRCECHIIIPAGKKLFSDKEVWELGLDAEPILTPEYHECGYRGK